MGRSQSNERCGKKSRRETEIDPAMTFEDCTTRKKEDLTDTRSSNFQNFCYEAVSRRDHLSRDELTGPGSK